MCYQTYNNTGHQSVSTNEYKVCGGNLDLKKTIIRAKRQTYIEQHPYVGEDGIYMPCEWYVE